MKRMCALYQKAIDFPYVDENGVKRSKFVNLDMEEYKDAHFTLRLFKEVLSRPEFKNYSAGIVVQAYLPDAYEFQTELLDFAKARMADGGAPLKMRLVKGCNLEMETVISSLRGWPNPVRTSKTEVDANYCIFWNGLCYRRMQKPCMWGSLLIICSLLHTPIC